MTQKVPARTKALCGVADSDLATLVVATQFYLLFYYTDVALVNAAVAGTALMVGKLTWFPITKTSHAGLVAQLEESAGD
jgi:Na+/melibiose symporter-like transporter